MKKFVLFSCCVLLLGLTNEAHAQFFKKIKDHISDKVADKVNDEADKVMDGKKDSSGQASSNQAHNNISINVPFDFKPGDSVLFKDNFMRDSVGNFPKHWKTNASGAVVAVPGFRGRWFMLNSDATYKLDTLLSMPENFTVEFDVLALSDKVRDLGTFITGFSRDNSAREFLDDVGIAGVKLYYMNQHEIYTSSKDLGVYHFGDFDLTNTINAPLHISIQVNGNHMKAYLGETRILDADMFKTGSRKYFFISAPLDYDNNAKILISNVRIAQS